MTRTATLSDFLALLAAALLFGALGVRSVQAQAAVSDTVVIGATANGAAVVSPTIATRLEGSPEAQLVVPYGPLTVDFIEVTPVNSHLSDRFQIGTFNVQVTSDDETPLIPRAGSLALPENLYGRLVTVKAISDFESNTMLYSDTVSVTIGNGAPQFFNIPPLPEGDPELPIDFNISAQQFDLLEPDGSVSDYVDISPIHVYFLSSDDPGAYPNILVDGTITEFPDTVLEFSIDVNSDTGDIPEPACLALLTLSGPALLRRHRAYRS